MASEKLGKYRLEQKIAVGGMAEIWLARQEGPAGFAKRLVIKRILPHLARDAKFVEMFLDEARVAALLEHPNIVRISDLGQVDNSYFIAMEFIDGPDLDYMIARARQLGTQIPLVIAARIVADALSGLDYAHQFADETGHSLGLVHRDISPHNVLISNTGVAKVCDFGVAKAATSKHQTQAGAVKGKFAYMSPEQIAAKPLDGRSDVFAMGIVLYELTTNQRPFGDQGELMAVTAILTQQPTDPRQFVKNYPPEMEQIIHRSLTKSRDERYASARAMQEDLERFIQATGQVITARDVATYIQDLFSVQPSFWASPGVAPPLPPRYDVDARMPWETRAQEPVRVNPEDHFHPEEDEPEDDSLADTAESPRLDKPRPAPPELAPTAIPEPTPTVTQEPEPPRPPESRPPRVTQHHSEVATRQTRPEPSVSSPPVAESGGGNKGLVLALVGVLGLLLLVAAGGGLYFFSSQEDGEKKPVAHKDAGVSHKAADAGVVSHKGKDAADSPQIDQGKADPPAAETGKVVVISTPPVHVFHEGKDLGATPLKVALPLGSQSLTLRDPRRGIFKEVTVKVDPKTMGEVLQTFEFGSVAAKLPATPGLQLWVDGAPFPGDASKPIILSAGPHLLELKDAKGDATASRPVTVEPDKESQVKF